MKKWMQALSLLPMIDLQLFAEKDEEIEGEEFDEQGRPLTENPLFQEDSEIEGQTDDSVESPITDDPEGDIEGEPVEEPEGGEGETFDVKAYLKTLEDRIGSIAPQGETQEPNQGEGEIQDPPTESPEDLEQMNEEFLSRFYDDPMGVVKELAESIANEKVKPFEEERDQMRRQRELESTVKNFEQENPDFNDYVDDIVAQLEATPELQNSPRGLELAYKLAKADKLSQGPQSVEDLLSDEGNLEKITQDPKIKDLILKEHMKGVSNKRPPKDIGGGPSGASAPLHHGEKPTTLREATDLFMKSFD